MCFMALFLNFTKKDVYLCLIFITHKIKHFAIAKSTRHKVYFTPHGVAFLDINIALLKHIQAFKTFLAMNNDNFTTAFAVSQTPQQAFGAITKVTDWWTENLEGSSQKVGDEFSVRFGDVHYSKHKLTEVIPNKKVVWLTTDSRLSFVADTAEWTDTQIIFDITEKDGKTEVRFTQAGLAPRVECYNDCSGAWTYYIQDSLRPLIETGKGVPTRKVNG